MAVANSLDEPELGTADWSDDENSAIVADYFSMLNSELEGKAFNKSEHRRALVQRIKRSEGSIERKHQNISAVLKGLGERWIDGYKPLFNYQHSLEEIVAHWLSEHSDWFERLPSAGGFAEQSIFIGPAPTLRNAPPPDEQEQASRTAQKYNVAFRDEMNRRLGRAGESCVVDYERQVLRQANRTDLAEKVEWVSQTQGDGLGFDIASFEPTGKPRLIEVKTTNGWERTPFHITRNELDVAGERSDEWTLVRLWDFSRRRRAFEIRPPLERHVSLTPTSFQARFQH